MTCFVRIYGDCPPYSRVITDVNRVSCWPSEELAVIHSEKLENLLNVVLWFADGKTETIKSAIDCEMF